MHDQIRLRGVLTAMLVHSGDQHTYDNDLTLMSLEVTNSRGHKTSTTGKLYVEVIVHGNIVLDYVTHYNTFHYK